MAFELFERKARPTSTVPTIGLQTRGTMSLNAPAFALLASTQGATPAKVSIKAEKAGGKALRKQTAKIGDGADALVEFLYDKENEVVGMRLAPPDSLNSYPVRRQPESESYLVTAKAFLVYHKLETSELRRFVARLYDGNILGFSLKDEMK